MLGPSAKISSWGSHIGGRPIARKLCPTLHGYTWKQKLVIPWDFSSPNLHWTSPCFCHVYLFFGNRKSVIVFHFFWTNCLIFRKMSILHIGETHHANDIGGGGEEGKGVGGRTWNVRPLNVAMNNCISKALVALVVVIVLSIVHCWAPVRNARQHDL